MRRTVLSFALLMSVIACSSEEKASKAPEAVSMTATGTALDLGAITVMVPDGWTTQPPSSSMRKAQFVLPKQGDDAEDAEMVVFYFGTGSAGSVDANLDRWRGQMIGAEGDTQKGSANGMAVTTLDVKGAYASSMGPRMQPGQTKPNFRMIASIVESPAGAYYFKLTGPQITISHWHGSFTQFINSAKGS
jgi:hypothetical protein